MKSKMKTKFGMARIKNDGYYEISSRKEGNHNKLLHRLIWEDFYGVNIPKGYVIHHKNENKTDNCILNLQLMRKSDHRKLHMNGKHWEDAIMVKASKSHDNSTGYFRVTKQVSKTCKKGFIYRYHYYENNKRKAIVSTKLDDLKEKVLKNGLIWKKIGENIEV